MPDYIGPPPGDIVSYLPGNYTPGAESTLDILCDLINASWKYGLAKSQEVQARIDQMIDPNTGWLAQQNAPHIALDPGEVPQREVVEPAVDIPASTSAADIMDLWDSKYLDLIEVLKQAFIAFRASYFPDEQAAYEAVENWLRAALANPDEALPPGVREALFTDSRDRLLNEAARAQDAVLGEFAARRFPLPPGAAAAAVLQVQQGAQDKISEAARRLVTDWVENMRFAVTNTLQLRQIAMDSAVRYITALASGPDLASRALGIGYDAQSKLITAAAAFYNCRIGVQEMKTKIDQFNVGTDLTVAKSNQEADLALIDAKLRALLAQCQTLAQMAASLFNNIQASAGSRYEASGTTSNN